MKTLSLKTNMVLNAFRSVLSLSGEWRQVLHGWLCAEEHAV